jgi:hypothetical protein
MRKETKIGNAVIIEQTIYYYYASEEDIKNGKYVFCTSDKEIINKSKRDLRSFLKNSKKQE